jgi:hypothetical protein
VIHWKYVWIIERWGEAGAPDSLWDFHEQGDPAFSISPLAGRRLIANRLEKYQ